MVRCIRTALQGNRLFSGMTPAPPGAVTASAVAGSYTSLEVRWGAPETAGGPVLTGYELR